MHDTLKLLMTALLTGALLTLSGCGGGGSSVTPTSPTTKIAGTASKGLITHGTVTIYSLDGAGVRGAAPLATAATDSNGQFSADIGTYSGPIAVEVTGSYIDEATGATVTIGAARPMRAAFDAVSPATTRRFAVTPLTDLAYSLAGPLTAANIVAANSRVSSIFKIADVTVVEPVAATVTALTNASQAQQAYTLALAALSQAAATKNTGVPAAFSHIDALLTSYLSDLTVSATSGLGTVNATAFATALGAVASGPLNGFTNAVSSLGSVGTTSLTLTISVNGVPGSTKIAAMQGTITLKAGTSVRLQSGTQEVLPGLFTLTGAANSLATTAYMPPALSFAIINASGFSQGDVATLVVDVASGSPTAADFALSGTKVLDINGATITGASIVLK